MFLKCVSSSDLNLSTEQEDIIRMFRQFIENYNSSPSKAVIAECALSSHDDMQYCAGSASTF